MSGALKRDEWETVRLGDVCDVRDGTHDSPKYILEGGYPLVTSKNIQNDSINLTDVNFISETDYLAINKRSRVDDGDILMPMIGTIGNPIIVKKTFAFAIKNLALIKFEDATLLNRYVLYLLSSEYFSNYILSENRGGTQKFLSLNAIRNFTFLLPPLDIQRRIADTLDKVTGLITLRKTQLEKLDELIKSRFVELFGERLEKETVKLSTLTEVITKGTTPTTLGFEFTESGINFVKIECITEDSKFIVSKMLHISDECNQKLKRSILQENDILFSIAGAIGRTAIVTKEILPANTNQAVAIIRLKANCGLNVKFLNQMLHSSLIEKQVNVKKAGVAQVNLSLADIGDFNVIVPPIEEQERFAAFVEQTDKSKVIIQQSLDALETLKKSLMQEYFG